MSLKTDIEAYFDGENRWPGGMDTEAELVTDEIVDHGSWSVIHEAVYLRKTISGRDPLTFTDEYVSVRYHEPATEGQDWDEFDAPVVTEVVPREVVTITFDPKE